MALKLLKNKLYAYQRKGLKVGLRQDFAAFFMPPGTGKTIVVLALLMIRWRRGQVKRILIMCPKCVISVWKFQTRLHLNRPFRFYTADDPPELLLSKSYYPQFYVINYESKHAYKELNFLMELIEFDAITLDESHRIMNPKGKRSKMIRKHTEHILYRIIMTGTPLAESLINMWAQIRFLSRYIWTEDFKQFTLKYCRRTGYQGHNLKIKPKWKKMLLKKIKDFTYSVNKRKVLGYPPTHTIIDVDLCAKTRKIYDGVESGLEYNVHGVEADLDLGIEALSMCQQITGGFLPIPDEDAMIELKQDKLSMLVDLLYDLTHEKVVIFCMYKAEVERIFEAVTALGRKSVKVRGGLKTNDVSWQWFQDPKKGYDTAVLQIQAGGIGQDYFTASQGVFFSNTYDPILYEQALGRLDRKGQREKITFWHLIAKNSIDEDKLLSLNSKQSNLNAVLTFLRRRTKMVKKLVKKDKKIAKPKSAKKIPKPKAAKKPEKKAEKKTDKKKEAPIQYGVDWVAHQLDVDVATARRKLRTAGIDKGDKKSYDFETKTKASEVIKKLSK
jgi:SNF2 family DNA or RNA helicase